MALLERISEVYQERAGDLAAALTEEMGAPKRLAGGFQVGLGAGHLATAIELLKNFVFEEQRGATYRVGGSASTIIDRPATLPSSSASVAAQPTRGR